MLSAPDLSRVLERVWPRVVDLGLDPGHVHFELVDTQTIADLAASGGLPARYGHWSFGKSRARLKTSFDYGLTQIYELVINHRPAYAFVDRSVSVPQALMIVAHVAAHADFFRHHRGFCDVKPDMIAVAARHRRRIAKLSQTYGIGEVESLIDAAHVLADFTGEQLDRAGIGQRADDVLGQAALFAPRLQDWEREVLAVVWDEARYFWPQQVTRMANEGYATFCHAEILHNLRLTPEEAWQTAHLAAQITAPTPPQLNPYQLGCRLYQEIFAHGGWEAVFGARTLYDDVGLVRAFFSQAVADSVRLALYRERDREPLGQLIPVHEQQRQLMTEFDRGGMPRITVEQPGPGEWVLRHHDDGRDLDFAELPMALKMVSERIFKGPVVLWTMRQGVRRRVMHDGIDFRDEAV